MPQLTHDIRTEIVKRLACFEKPVDIVKWLKSEADIEVDLNRVLYHDPTRIKGKNLAPKWRAIFEATRKAYLSDVSTIPISSQSYRLAQMQSLFEDAVKAKNRGQALQIMEQAAKEMGGVYSNVRTLNTPDMAGGGDQIPQHERMQKLASIIDGALGSLKNVTPLPAK